MVILLTLAVAGCGGDQTKAAATCLRNALANRALGGGDNCADSTAATVDSPNVTCTHQNGNQYVCHVTAPSFDPLNIGNHFYNVTYDGKSIVYQQTQ